MSDCTILCTSIVKETDECFEETNGRGYVNYKKKDGKNMLDLKSIRGEIDQIDEEIVRLFEKRMDLCRNVAEYKIATGKPVLDRQREQEKIETLTALTDNNFNAHGIEELFQQIMAMSRKLQYKLLVKNGVEQKLEYEKVERLKKDHIKVVYQGVPGAYSYAAMQKYFGEDVENYNAATFKEAMQEIAEGRADYAVLPIENSTAGIVTDVYDLLVEFDNCIVAETAIKINHALLGLKDADISDIRTVYSHPQALMQSAEYLEEHKDWNTISMSNTAVSAKKVIEKGDKSCAAIASVTAAKIYGLKVLQEHLNISNENMTKFIVVSRKNIYRENATKTLVTFEIPHSTGSLYNILSNFIYNNLNMCKIESRPAKGQNWNYRFFVEIEGTLEQSAVKNALYGVKAEATSLKILGCY